MLTVGLDMSWNALTGVLSGDMAKLAFLALSCMATGPGMGIMLSGVSLVVNNPVGIQ